MKKAIIALLCVAILAGGGYFGYRTYIKQRDEKKVVDVVPVNMMAQSEDMFMYSGTDTWGYINAANAQKIYVDTNKLVQKVCVRQGDTVKKGDTILEYDMTVVELELAQKENKVRMAEQDIKMANKELNEIKGYRPSEEAPQEPDFPEEPDFPDEPDLPDVQPLITLNELTGALQPASGLGTAEDPMIFNCNLNTIVRVPFQIALSGSRRCAVLYVYDENDTYLYQWRLDGSTIKPAEAAEWIVTDGLIVDAESGTVSIDPEGTLHGQLSFAMPVGMMPEEESPEMPEDTEPEWTPDEDFGDDYVPPVSNDYMYSRKEIQRMIAEQEAQIKELEIELKAAELAYENAKKQKSDGRVVAEIDGVVKKIGKAADESEEEQPAEEPDPFAEPEEDDNAFAVIEGAGGVEVICEVPEMALARLPVGTIVTVQSYQNGAFTEAEVTGVDEEPSSYEANPWETNPNSSIYHLHAKLMDSEDFSIGGGVSVSVPAGQNESAEKKSVYIPIHYVRQEGGDYYVMKAGADDRLVKQYVGAGQIMWGAYIEITGGLDVKNDRICFPFGSDVKEGVRTQDSTEILYPSYY